MSSEFASLIRKYIAEANDYSWDVSNRKNMLLDQPGMEQEDKDNTEEYLKSMGLMENIIALYLRGILSEKELRGQKSKRTLYHIGKRPAEPKPAERWGAKGEEGWSRDWIEGPVKSGVFLTPNPTDIAWNHGVSGNVYAYKVPQWVIEKSGGVNRFDTGSEILISQEIWEEAGDEIEFLGKTMGKDELWDSVDSSYYSSKQKKGVRGAHKHDDGASSISGLRSTNHPEAAIKMMSQEEIEKALAKFENEYAQEGPAEVVKGPRDKKGLVIPYLGKQPRGKDKELIDLLNKYMKESVVRQYIKDLLVEVPLDDFEYVSKDHDDVMVREEVADYFKAIPQSVNIYVAHTDDLSWAHRLPNEIQGKVSGFKSRGQVTLTDISNIGELYPQIQRAMHPEGINLLYVYPKSFEVPAGGDTFIADVNPHYLAHDLHHMLENAPGRERGEKDKFTSLIKEYLMELVWLSHGGGSVEAEQVRDTMRRTGRRLGVANTNLLMSELFPGIKLPSGDFDLFGDVFADYLKNDGNLVLGVPEQLDYDGTVIELNPGSKHDQRAQQYEKKFKDLFNAVLDPLKGKVAMFNIFEVEHREVERARKQAEEKMQADHGQLIDHIKSMGGEFKYFDESHREEGVEELIFDTGLKPEKPVYGIEEFTQQFPEEAAGIEALGYKITSAFDGFGGSSVEIRLKMAGIKESVLRKYIRQLLKEDPMGFVHDLAASDKFGDQFRGGQVGKDAGRDIKRAFNKNADHQFLSTLDTVHWFYTVYDLEPLVGKGKDELSATMTLPGDSFDPAGLPYGLWIKGRITLATNEQDKMYSGFYGDYGAGYEGSEEEVAHRDRSSGRNKRPSVSKDYSRYGQLERGNEYMEKMARDGIPYILDQSTWNPGKTRSNNEALVDNWRPIGIIVAKNDVIKAILKAAKKLAGEGGTPPSGNIAKDINYFSTGVTQEIILAALQLGVPIYDTSRTKLWGPPTHQSGTQKELRQYVRGQLILEDRILQENVFKKAISWVKEKGQAGIEATREFLTDLKEELSETREGAALLTKLASGKNLSPEETGFLKQQAKDVASGTVLLGLFALPGGGLATAALLKVAGKVGVNLKPTAFRGNDETTS